MCVTIKVQADLQRWVRIGSGWLNAMVDRSIGTALFFSKVLDSYENVKYENGNCVTIANHLPRQNTL